MREARTPEMRKVRASSVGCYGGLLDCSLVPSALVAMAVHREKPPRCCQNMGQMVSMSVCRYVQTRDRRAREKFKTPLALGGGSFVRRGYEPRRKRFSQCAVPW